MMRIATLAATSAIALGLAGCDDGDRARIDAPEPAPLAELTTEAIDLPYAEPAPVEVYAPDQGYRWAERAYGLQRAVYDTPPDYGFAYDGIEPMVWETEDDWTLYAEPWEGSYRYYYYEPGAAYPYFVRDDRYGYAFSAAGILIALFDSGGRYVPAYEVYRYAPLAGRYYVRGRDLRNAAVQSRRIRVSEEVWSTQAPRFLRGSDPWLRAAREERTWRAWRERDRDRELARFEDESRRRREVAHRWRQEMDARDPAVIERRQRRAEAQAAQPDRQALPRGERRERQLAEADARRETRERLARSAQLPSLEAQAERRRQVQRQQAAERLEARAAPRRDRQQQAQAEQRRQALAQRQQAERGQAIAAQRRQAQEQAQAAERRQQLQAQRQQAQAEQRQQMQAQRQQAAQAERQQAQAEQRRQMQAQRQQAAQAERQQAMAEQRRQMQAQRQQAQAEQRRQAEVQRQQAQAEQRQQAQRQQARAAAEQGQAAAARERGEGRGRDKDRKD